MNNANRDAAHALLTELRSRGVPCCIAGGYVRDSILNRPIRDIDLYVGYGHFKQAVQLLDLTGEDEARQVFDADHDAYRHQSINSQNEYILPSALADVLPTNIINVIELVNEDVDPRAVISKFNIGICQAAYCSITGIHTTDAFSKDIMRQRLTLYRTDWGHEASLKQLIKLTRKYDWPIYIKHTA